MSANSYHHSDHRTLILTDDALLARLLKHHLTRADFAVDTAESAADAIERARNQTPHVLLVDWRIGNVSGIEFCRRFRALPNIPWAFVILMTERDVTDQVLEAMEAGADDFLTKPFDMRELLARVRIGERVTVLERELRAASERSEGTARRLEITNLELRRVNERLRRLARTDELTGLGNRRAAMEELERAWRDAERHLTPLACVTFDIDRFKLINDTHGHDVGDALLVRLAAEIMGQARLSERPYRIGGEEFLVICPRATESDAFAIAERLRAAIAAITLQTGSESISTTASFGVAARGPGMSAAGDLLRAADRALYTAKHEGRNCVRRTTEVSERPFAINGDAPDDTEPESPSLRIP